MDGATELQEDSFLPLDGIERLKELASVDRLALSLDQSIVQTAILTALLVTAGESHKWPKTVAGSCNCEAELNRTMQAYERRVANGDVVSDVSIP